jgi:hypothetical protein|tara:strand:+ start:193 stop:462 length:270 start_codon:yes stop_codon:yes gene_type:complete
MTVNKYSDGKRDYILQEEEMSMVRYFLETYLEAHKDIIKSMKEDFYDMKDVEPRDENLAIEKQNLHDSIVTSEYFDDIAEEFVKELGTK